MIWYHTQSFELHHDSQQTNRNLLTSHPDKAFRYRLYAIDYNLSKSKRERRSECSQASNLDASHYANDST